MFSKVRLNSLTSSRQRQFETIDPHKIMSSLKLLADQINGLFKNNFNDLPHNFFNRLQERFQRVQVDIPQLPVYEDKNIEQRKYLLQKWLGKLCHQVFSITFSLYEHQKLTDKETKAFCCQNMISNIIHMIKSNKLNPDEIGCINKCLKQELIPYFAMKYPISEEAQVNIEFANRIIEVDSLGKNQNDLVFKSGVKFQYRQDASYGAEIMKFLNYVIQLPNKKYQDEDISLFKKFYQDMQTFFKNVEEQKFTILMNDTRKQKLKQNLKFTSLSMKEELKIFSSLMEPPKDLQLQKQQQKYRENVGTYTKKLIGRKISENIKPFSSIQIKQGQLKLRNPAIMRIVTKWCDELMYNFNIQPNILNKQDQFRMKDGGQKILKRKHLLILAELLKREKKNVDQYLQKVNKNNHESQFDFSSQTIPKFLEKLSEGQCQVGLFAASQIRNYQTYLVGYVNTIIHSLMTATKDYEEMVKAYEYKQDQYGEYIDNWRSGKIKFEELVKRAYSYRLASVPVSYLSLVPQLISFRVGDILRCRCTSKEKQIIALYSWLDSISRQENSPMKIVKIRNRLEGGTKDILINILYRNKTLVQMQLGIATTRTKFIDFSNKFNHVLYELKRSVFGPISQLSNIWINNDVKAQYYIEKCRKTNVRKVVHSKTQSHVCSGQSIEFPFRCSFCSYFYNDCSYALKHIKCTNQNCKKLICSLCQAEKFTYQNLKEKYPEIPSIQIVGMKQKQKYWEYKKRLSSQKTSKQYLLGEESQGILLDLKSKDKPFYYKIFKRNKQTVLKVKIKQKFQIKVIKQLRSTEQIEIFKKEYLIFSSKVITEMIRPIDDDQTLRRFMTEYSFPRYLKKWNQKQKSTIVYMSSGLNDNDLKSIDYTFPCASKVCFYDNKITHIEPVAQIFQKCEIFDLGENNIQKLDNCPQIKQKIQVLYLNYNRISEITPKFIENAHTLQQLQLANNEIVNLPSNFGSLSKLKILNMSRNNFTKLPEEITALTQLEVLNLYSSPKNDSVKLVELSESIGRLKILRKINLNFNNIKKFPDSIGELKSLQILYAAKNCLESLPNAFSGLTNLKILNLASNNFNQIPQIIGSLTELQILNMQKSSSVVKKVKKLPDSFSKLRNIKMMDISQNNLTELPRQLGNLSLMETFFIYENQLEEIPDSIGKLQELKLLYSSNNKLKILPDSICNLKNLQKLTLKQNKELKQLPNKIYELKQLKTLICNNTSLAQLPQLFGQLQSLKQLLVNNTKITHLPASFVKLRNLSKIQIDLDKLDGQSKKIIKSMNLPTL